MILVKYSNIVVTDDFLMRINVFLCFRDVSSNIAVPSTSNGNAYVFLCSQNNQGGVVGIAWVRGTCSSSRFARSSVNEYLNNDVVSASVSLLPK